MTTLEEARAKFAKQSEQGIKPHEEARDFCPADPDAQTLVGLNFVLTGRLSQTRKEISTLIARHGGCVCPNVGKRIDFVVKGSLSEGVSSIKLDRAEQLGIDVIDERTLNRMIVDGPKQHTEGRKNDEQTGSW